MAIDTRVAQKDKLYTILFIKHAIEKAGQPVLLEIHLLENLAMAAMEPEDVAYVQKQIAFL